MRPCNSLRLRPQQVQRVTAVRCIVEIGGKRSKAAVTSKATTPPSRSASSSSTLSLSSRCRRHLLHLRVPPLRAMEPSRGGVGTEFEGAYGPWTLEESDVLEVRLYRASLLVSALAFAGVVAVGGGGGGQQSGGGSLLPATAVDALAATSAVGLGAALALVHVYVTPLKRLLQVLWLAGCAGAVAVAVGAASSHGIEGSASASASLSPASLSIADAVASDPGSIWLIGPAAAAATGLAFKEGLCYGKAEAAALFLAIPSLCLFHLFSPALGGVLPLESVVFPLERFGSAVVALLGVVFALNKVLAQPVAEDVGDKSVFTFRKLGPEEQRRVLAEVRSRALFGEDAGVGGRGGGGRGSGGSSSSSGSGSSSGDDEY